MKSIQALVKSVANKKWVFLFSIVSRHSIFYYIKYYHMLHYISIKLNYMITVKFCMFSLYLLPHTAHLLYFHLSLFVCHILDFIPILFLFYYYFIPILLLFYFCFITILLLFYSYLIYSTRFIGSVFALTTDSVLRMLNIGRDDTKRLPLKVITAVFLPSSSFSLLTPYPCFLSTLLSSLLPSASFLLPFLLSWPV